MCKHISAVLSGSVLASFLLLSLPAHAQEIAVSVEDLACIPIADNSAVSATVTNDQPGTETRLYFRRMHEEVEDFYYVVMQPVSAGEYRGVLPKPADEELEPRELEERREEERRESDGVEWAEWWREKEMQDDRDPNDDLDQDVIRERASIGKLEPRSWMAGLSDEEFQDWLERLENEPAEYYGAVYDPYGRLLAKSPMKVVEVQEDCDFVLTPQEEGRARNLVIGETQVWQQGEEVFHWLCDGIVTRIDPQGILREDEECRACVIAWWKRPGVIAGAAGAAGIAGILISEDEPGDASPSAP